MRRVDFPKTDQEFFVWVNSSVSKNLSFRLSKILFRNCASLQYSFCGVTIAFEYRRKAGDRLKNQGVSTSISLPSPGRHFGGVSKASRLTLLLRVNSPEPDLVSPLTPSIIFRGTPSIWRE